MEMHRFIHESLRILVTIGGCIWLGQAASAQQIGTCRRFQGEAYLDANNVSARIMNTGGLFYRGEPREYRVPRFERHLCGSDLDRGNDRWPVSIVRCLFPQTDGRKARANAKDGSCQVSAPR